MASELEQLIHQIFDARLLELRHLFHLDGVSQAAIASGDALAGGTVGGAEDAGGAGLGGSEDGGAAGASGGVDSMTPNYLTINASGAVGALFAGGVSIPEVGGIIHSAPASVSFVDPGNVARSWLAGAALAGNVHQIILIADADANLTDYAAVAPLAAVAGAGGASQVLLLAADSTTGIAQSQLAFDSLKRSGFVQSVAAIVEQRMSRAASCHNAGAQGVAVAGWNTFTPGTVDFDPDGLLTPGLALTAPSAGQYRVHLRLGLTNGVGSNQMAAIGWGGIGILEQVQVVTGQTYWFNGDEVLSLAAGAVIAPSVWVAAVGGFNWQIVAGSQFTVQRVA